MKEDVICGITVTVSRWMILNTSNLCDTDASWQCTAHSRGLQRFNTVETVHVFHFDFYKNMPTPKLSGVNSFIKGSLIRLRLVEQEPSTLFRGQMTALAKTKQLHYVVLPGFNTKRSLLQN